MNGEVGDTTPAGYERPWVKDYGTLVEMTAGMGPVPVCEDGATKTMGPICSEPPI